MSAGADMLRKLLADSRRAGHCHLPHDQRAAVQAAAHDLGFMWLEADLGRLRKASSVLVRLGRDLGLPDWYGANFDALADCLTDFNGNEAPGYVLRLSGGDLLRADDAAAGRTLDEVLAFAIGHWREAGIPFWVFDATRAGTLPAFPALPAASAG